MKLCWRMLVGLAAAVVLLGACGGAGGGRPAADDLGPVRWRWHAPVPASVGMPVADDAGSAATYGHVALVSFAPDGAVRWEVRRLGVREEAPLLTSDLIVVPTDDGLVAVDRATGRTRWDTHIGNAASTPVLASRVVVTCGSAGSLVAVDVGTGTVAWRAQLRGRAEGPPATDGHTVVATWEPERGESAGVTAVDAATGVERWTAPLQAGGVSGPAVIPADSGSYVVAVDDDLAAKAFDLDDGRRLWSSSVGSAGAPEVPPLGLTDGRVLVADRRAGLTLLDSTGRRLWSSPASAAATRGGPVGPALSGSYVLPLYNGSVLLAGPGRSRNTVDAEGGLANGVAMGPSGVVLIASAQGRDNQLVAYGS
jgi:outer membrane protein assembly factor BamB